MKILNFIDEKDLLTRDYLSKIKGGTGKSVQIDSWDDNSGIIDDQIDSWDDNSGKVEDGSSDDILTVSSDENEGN